MTKVSEIYSSPYLKGEDLNGKRVQVTIITVEEVEVPDFNDKDRMIPKILAGFEGKDKQMLVGRQNAEVLAESLGDDTSSWVNKTIEIFSQRESIGGSMKNVLRVNVPQQVEQSEETESSPGF